MVFDGVGVRGFRGINGWFKELERKSYRMHVRILLARYRAYITCSACGGTRLRSEASNYRLGGLTVADVHALTVQHAADWLSDAVMGGCPTPGERQHRPGADTSTLASMRPVLQQLSQRLSYLQQVGIGYLTLDRQARTLSGGELQRANLTTALGSGLVNTLFVLDEPTIGLHPSDADRLAGLLRELSTRDNTVVVVEHDPDMLRIADHIVEFGPGPGTHGGRVTFSGAAAGLMAAADSPTARALAKRAEPRQLPIVAANATTALWIRNAREHNLKGIDLRFPVGRFTVITGPSGSGKSTLLNHVLYRAYQRSRGRPTDRPGKHDAIEGFEHFRRRRMDRPDRTGREHASQRRNIRQSLGRDTQTVFCATPCRPTRLPTGHVFVQCRHWAVRNVRGRGIRKNRDAVSGGRPPTL